MHEAKYEPMDKVDAEKIMEEILGMQAGLNPDQQVNETSAVFGQQGLAVLYRKMAPET